MQKRFPFALLLTLSFLLGACSSSCSFLPEELQPTVSEPPRSEYDAVVAAVLRYSFVEAQDTPGHEQLSDSRYIVLSNITSVLDPFEASRLHRDGEKLGPLDTLTAHALPTSGEVQFFLHSPEEIQRLADERGAFVYAQIGRIEIEDNEANATVALSWAAPLDYETVFLSGGGYELKFRREGNDWLFAEVRSGWES